MWYTTYFARVSIAMLLGTSSAFGQSNFYEHMTSMWFAGNKTGVLAIAEQRLQNDTNDIAGLLLKMEYEIEFLDFGHVENTMGHVLQVGSSISSTNFARFFPRLQADILHLLEMIPHYPSDELANDRAKSNLPNKPFMYSIALRALYDDGFFQ